MDEYAGLAGAGAGEYEIVSGRCRNGFALGGIEVIEQMRNVHPAILPAFVRALAALGLLAASAAATAALDYRLSYEPDGQRMLVRVCADTAAARREFTLAAGAAANIEELQREHGEVSRRGDARWRVVDWRAGECLSYRAALAPIARRNDYDAGVEVGVDLLVAPQQWLLRSDADEAAQVQVTMPPGVAFSPPWEALDGSTAQRGRFRLPRTPASWSGLVAIGGFDESTLALPGGSVRVVMLGGIAPAHRTTLLRWVEHALQAVSSGHGELPLPQAQVVLRPVAMRGGRVVGFGQSLRGQGNAVHIQVDPRASLQQLDADWTAVHEFSHWAHPYLGDDGAWLAEGLASYWQNLLRARTGLLAPQQAWEQLDAGFGRGRGVAGDQLSLAELSGVMHERRAYYAVYWSGAAYWLQVDVELRRRSGGKLDAGEALRRFRACCLLDRRAWEPRAFAAKLDELVATEVFLPRYDEFAARKGFPPVDVLYRELGLVRGADGALGFDDKAQDAQLRKALTQRR